ncbi:MAG TPA: PadR family transcriptional regulator [Solirubrobacteraceae bacterium]|nr:PadR family transcriptional regulator [Solirubrobacteraceae bacterium]
MIGRELHDWGFGGGGRRRRGHVRQAILALLTEEPDNGYGLMQRIEAGSGGRWRPSSGSIYPTLAQLEDEGLVRMSEHDGGKRYELTDAGRTRAAETPETPWRADSEDGTPDLRGALKPLAVAVMQVSQAGDREQLEQAAALMERTRHDLYRILAGEP